MYLNEVRRLAFLIYIDGRRERVAFDKITSRIGKLCYGLDMNFVDPAEIAQKVTVLFFYNIWLFKVSIKV